MKNHRINFFILITCVSLSKWVFLSIVFASNKSAPRGLSRKLKTCMSTSSPSSQTQSYSSSVKLAKNQLLEAVSYTRKNKSFVSGGEGLYEDKRKIVECVGNLEKLMLASDNANTCSNGRWCLIYSTRVDPSASLSLSPSFIDIISGNLYKLFFKFAPFLAGGSESSASAETALSQIANEQVIDLLNGSLINAVSFKVPTIFPFSNDNKNDDGKVTITVRGELKPVSTDEVNVVFSSFKLDLYGQHIFTIPLPRPKGTLRTTYCDSDVRISRGGQGGVFIVKRIVQ